MECPVGVTPCEEASGRQSVDVDVSPTEFAQLGCVASGCRYCGNEFSNCMRPRGEHPWIDVGRQTGAEVTLGRLSQPVLLLSFASEGDRKSTWPYLLGQLGLGSAVVWSECCTAGLPCSGRQSGGVASDIVKAYGTNRCSMMIIPSMLPFAGVWTDEMLVLELRSWLGCLHGDGYARVMERVIRWTCEFVPLVELKRWEDGRKRVIDGSWKVNVSGELVQ